MNDLLRYLENDLPQINAFIHSEISRLDPFIGKVAGHVLKAGGKRLRPALTLITARSLGAGGGVDLMPLACSLEFLHSATLLHDDILDGAVLRRGRQAAHLVFGNRETVLAGDVLLALANSLAASYGDARITQALAEAIMGTAAGEVREIAKTRDTSLSLNDYLTIITEKTALLFQCACATGAMAAGADDAMVQGAKAYGLNLGIAFQIVDDALDYAENPDTTGKPKAGDLREGKMTLPLIMLLETLTGEKRALLKGKIASGDLDDDDIRDVLARVEAGGFAQAARDEAAKYAKKAKHAIALFPDNKEKQLMTAILDFVLNRNL